MRLIIYVFIALAVLGLVWFVMRPGTPKYNVLVLQPVPAQAPREAGPAPRDQTRYRAQMLPPVPAKAPGEAGRK